MPTVGDEILILEDGTALSKSVPNVGDDVVVYDSDDSRGDSVPSVGDDVVLSKSALAQGPSGEAAGVIYYAEFRGDGSNERIYKLDKESFDVLESFDIDWVPHGIGGDEDVVWVGDDNSKTTAFKRDPTRLTKISEGTLPVNQTEMGGGEDVLYVCLNETGEVARLDPDTYEVQVRVDGPGDGVNGIGGKSGVCWHNTDHTVYELDPDDLSVLRSNNVQSQLQGGALVGIGGSETSIFAVEQSGANPNGFIHEVDPETLDITKTNEITFGTGEPSGVGGY